MRTGHNMTASHLYKINIKENPYCECGREENLNHVFLECPINFIPGFDFYHELIRSGLQAPLDIHTTLSNLSEVRIKLLMSFLLHNRIKL